MNRCVSTSDAEDDVGKINPLKNNMLGSQKFDEIILDSVDLLKLPPPMDLLIRHPPYVVTILIQP